MLDLIERLRASDTLSRGENYEPWVIPASELRLEAADTIAALRETANSWRRVAERLEGEKQAAESSLAEARRLLKAMLSNPDKISREQARAFLVQESNDGR